MIKLQVSITSPHKSLDSVTNETEHLRLDRKIPNIYIYIYVCVLYICIYNTKANTKKYWWPEINILIEYKDYNVMIDGENILEQPAKNDTKTYKSNRKLKLVN